MSLFLAFSSKTSNKYLAGEYANAASGKALAVQHPYWSRINRLHTACIKRLPKAIKGALLPTSFGRSAALPTVVAKICYLSIKRFHSSGVTSSKNCLKASTSSFAIGSFDGIFTLEIISTSTSLKTRSPASFSLK